MTYSLVIFTWQAYGIVWSTVLKTSIICYGISIIFNCVMSIVLINKNQSINQSINSKYSICLDISLGPFFVSSTNHVRFFITKTPKTSETWNNTPREEIHRSFHSTVLQSENLLICKSLTLQFNSSDSEKKIICN